MAQASMPQYVLQAGNARLESWGSAETLQAVGKAIPRRSGLDKVTGRARYAFDVQLPGMLYAAIVRSTEARGRVVAIDTERAAHIPGVRTILTPANFPTLPAQGRPALSQQVRFVGEEIAAVAAETEQAAHEATPAITGPGTPAISCRDRTRGGDAALCASIDAHGQHRWGRTGSLRARRSPARRGRGRLRAALCHGGPAP